MDEAIKRDLRLDLPEVSDVLLREMLVPGDPEEVRSPRDFVVGEVLTLYTEPLRQVCPISWYSQPSQQRSLQFGYSTHKLYVFVSLNLW